MSGGDDGSGTLADETAAVIARRAHYAAFFGDEPAPGGYGVVVGNCQAESIRLVVSNEEHPGVRVPAVHEMDAADADRLHRLLAGAAFLVVQPIRDDYRALPLGTSQLRAALPPGARTVVVTSLRNDSLAELRRREEIGVDVVASDLYDEVVPDLARTVNHPGNAVFLPLGERIVAALGAPGTAVDPGRPILAGVQAPLEPWVVDAWGLDAEPRRDWIVAGERLDPDAVVDAHRRWYAQHPEFVAAAVERLAPLLRRWRAA